MKNSLLVIYGIFVSILFIQTASAQFTIPPDTTTYWSANEVGVKIPWTRGPDSTMVKGQLVIRFHQNALDYNKLIQPYTNYYYGTTIEGKGNHIQSWPDFPHSDTDYRGFPDSLRKIVKLQRFYFDSSNNIVLNSSLKSFLQSAGGYYLRRLTTASPVDTLTLTHRGDTIGCDHYNWMVLVYDTTVNPLILSYFLTTSYPRDIDFAVPDRIGLKALRHPGDNIRNYDTCEIDLKQMINAEKAWDFEVGNPNIILALFDYGVDYRHPDLGAGFGKGKHVLYGMQFSVNANGTIDPINTNQGHGTPTAGIMGALTNRNATSVAGVAGGWGILPSDPIGSVDEGQGCSLAIIAASGAKKSDYIAGVFEAASHSVVTDYGNGVDAINTSWNIKKDGFHEPDLHGAINYAFETGVIQCAGLDEGGAGLDETPSPTSFPADYEEPWMICVGGSKPDKLWMPSTNYGYTMDLIAPAGDPQYGCAAGWAVNWTTKNLQVPPNEITTPIFAYDGFGGNSAATPHVTGSAGLILSWFSNPGHTDTPKLEPEDVGGILKASAWRSDSDRVNKNLPRTWRKKSRWGHLDIGKTFEMLDPNPDDAIDSRYVLRHYSYSDSLQYGDWLTQDSIPNVFDISCSPWVQGSNNFLKYKNRQYILNGVGGASHQEDVYYARVRPVTRIVSLDSIWEVDSIHTPLFAWGRSGSINEKSGWNFSTYNWQTGWSFIMDGMGGDTLNEGIFHSQNTTFTILTAQYDIWAWDTTTSGYTKHLGHVPADSMMGVNFSVYGRLQRAISDVKQPTSGNPSMMVSVNPAGDLVMAHVSANYEIDHATLAIFDILGRLQTSRYEGNLSAGENSLIYPINQLPSGTYILRLSGRGFTQSKSFHIIK